MKKLILGLILFATTNAFALDSECEVKMQNAAAFELAQTLAVPVQGTDILKAGPFRMTRMSHNNTIGGTVIVRAGNRINRGMTVVEYAIRARQIGSSNDCTIEEIFEYER